MLVIIITLSIFMSIDAMAVGLAYGIKNVKLPLLSKVIIGLCSMICGYISMTIGNFIAFLLPQNIESYVGSGILIIIGIWFLLQNLKSSQSINEKTTLFRLVIKSVGITITIVRDPMVGDIDHSGTIDRKESLLVGIALSMDILGAGLGLGVANLNSIFMPPAVGIFQILFLYAGLLIGSKIGNISSKYQTITGVLPGLIMITIALMKLLLKIT